MALRVVPIDATLDDPAAFGGKAAGLARLIRAGAFVPPAIAVSAGTRSPADWTDDERGGLLHAARPLLHAGPVAVRSSAVGEDSAARSFAGLFDSVLGVRDEGALVEAVARCIGSGSGARVQGYTGTTNAIPVGVVVQRQVEARAAGVCFTRDPTGRDRALVIEAVSGLGDRLVSGHAQPERWRVYRSGLGTLETRREDGPQAVLTEDEARALAKEALGLEAALEGPLDLEWAIDGVHRVSWVQARPITAAREPPPLQVRRSAPPGDDGPVTVWSNFNVRETMPDPFTPMNWALWRDIILPSVGEDLFGVRRNTPLMHVYLGIDLVQGRLYWNMNALLGSPMRLALVGKNGGALAGLDPEAARLTRHLMDAGVLRARRTGGGVGLWLAAAVSGLRSFVRLLSALSPGRTLHALKEAAAVVRARAPLESLPDADLLREAILFDTPLCAPFRRSMQTMAFGFVMLEAARRAFAAHPRARALLPTGILGPTTEISIGIDRLAGEARALGPAFDEAASVAQLRERLGGSDAGRAWLASLDAFLAANGQRAPREFEIATPRWAEDPTMIVDLVRAALRSGDVASQRLARAQAERAAAVAEAVAASPAWRRPLMRWLAHQVAAFMPLREAPKHYTMHLLLRMRRALLEIGRRLAARGVLGSGEDVMFLEMAEAHAALTGGDAHGLVTRVADRRREWAAFATLPAPHFVRSDGVPVDVPVPPRTDGALAGAPICHGVARGPARILRRPDPSLMQDGDVLVVEFADPGWTPLFPRAAAIVMEVGGVMCHAAVVARELGIPAVFGVVGATSALRDGAPVTVDGDRGLVTPS